MSEVEHGPAAGGSRLRDPAEVRRARRGLPLVRVLGVVLSLALGLLLLYPALLLTDVLVRSGEFDLLGHPAGMAGRVAVPVIGLFGGSVGVLRRRRWGRPLLLVTFAALAGYAWLQSSDPPEVNPDDTWFQNALLLWWPLMAYSAFAFLVLLLPTFERSEAGATGSEVPR